MTLHMRGLPWRKHSPVMAFHCSGADSQQWQKLRQHLTSNSVAPDDDVHAVDFYGTATTGHWTGATAFTMADEAKRSLAAIDARVAAVTWSGTPTAVPSHYPSR